MKSSARVPMRRKHVCERGIEEEEEENDVDISSRLRNCKERGGTRRSSRLGQRANPEASCGHC